MSSENTVDWLGVLVPRVQLNERLLVPRDRLADSAKSGDWGSALATLDDNPTLTANDWRPGGSSWFGPLHQAAWLGAPESVVRALVERGAWRSLKDSAGRRPADIARERGHTESVDALTPVYDVSLAPEAAAAMSRRLAELVEEAAAKSADGRVEIRHLDVMCLAERSDRVWFPIPGMYGGFSVELYKRRLHVASWSRVVGGSGRAYVITADRTVLVDEGFV